MPRRPTLHGVVCGSLVAVLALTVWLNGLGTFYTDIKPEVYINPWGSFLHYVQPWLPSPYLGSPNFNVGLAPVPLTLAPLRVLGLGAEATFKLFHLGLWLLAAVGTNRLLRTLAPSVGRWAGLTAGVAYVVNPYAVTAGATLAILLPMALLPWQVMCLVRALREPRSWRWPALFGLTFFAMSGMNVAVVPILQLLAVIPVVLALRRAEVLPWRIVATVLARCALFVVGLSSYWLVPAVSALRTGSQIVAASETFEGIAQVSSFPEVLRGLGMWSLYGRGPEGPWIPQFASYLTLWPVILITLCYPALALLCLRWAPPVVARAAALAIPGAAVIMVGLFPGLDPAAPSGHLLRWVLENVPALAAFRTTNKLGAVLFLFLALSLGAGVPVLARRVLRVPGVGAAVTPLAALLVFVLVLPAATGGLYISPFDVPAYWREVAAAVDARDDGTAVLFLPGQVRSHYRWSDERPDDVSNSLLSRSAIIPETTPNTSAPGANLLAALDDIVQSGTASGPAVSSMARYLGAGDVLVRHDTVWEDAGGARPATTEAIVRADPGLVGLANFGRPGENTAAPGIPPLSHAEATLPPLQLYGVRDPRPPTRVVPTGDSLVLAGDGWGIAAAAAAGLLDEAPLIRYAADLAPDEFADLLGSGHRLVLTDTNARRAVIPNRLVAGQGSLLPAEALVGPTRTLGRDPADQTVLAPSGVRVTATQQGGVFFDVPYGSPANAADGDPNTSWLFGDFGRAVGARLTITLPYPQPLGVVRVTQRVIGSVRIDRVTLSAGGRSVSATLTDDTPVGLDLGGVTADTIDLTVDALRGDGFNLVGVAEVDLGLGLVTERVARVPTTLSDRYSRLDATGRAAFGATPMDVLFTRVRNSADVTDDTERTLDRDFALPGDRQFEATAAIRVLGSLPGVLDELRGWSTRVRVRASGTWFEAGANRPSQAADADPTTGWQPSNPVVGSWWEVRTGRRPVTRVVIDQRSAAGTANRESAESPQDAASPGTRWATAARVSVDGRTVAAGSVGPGRSVITLPRGTTGERVRVTFTGVRGPAAAHPPVFTTIDTGASMQETGEQPCLGVAMLDGRPLLMRPVHQGQVVGESESGTTWRACAPTSLAAGGHELRAVPGFQLDSFTLRDQRGSTASAADAAPRAVVTSSSATARTIQVDAGNSPYAVVLGQGWDADWRASVNGRDLGQPVVLDGYSSGWVVPEGGSHEIRVVYGPRTAAFLALTVTLLTLAAALLLATRRIAGGRDDVVPVLSASSSARRLRSVAAPPWSRGLALVAVTAFGFGWGGLVACLVIVGAGRSRALAPARLVTIGAGLVMVSGIVYVIANREALGMVDAMVVSASMWPHHLAGAGLVAACVGAWRHHRDADPTTYGSQERPDPLAEDR